MYDRETGLYYLQSRYYDPEVGRFINADALVSTGQGILGNNMFAYCLNNPVCRKDIGGATSIECYDSDGNPATDDDKRFEGGKTSNVDPGGNGGGGSVGGSGNPAKPSVSNGGSLSKDSVAMDSSDALDAAIDYLGPGYAEAYPPGSGRFVSADGLRQVRMGYGDLLGNHAGASHINFDYIGYSKSFHVYLISR